MDFPHRMTYSQAEVEILRDETNPRDRGGYPMAWIATEHGAFFATLIMTGGRMMVSSDGEGLDFPGMNVVWRRWWPEEPPFPDDLREKAEEAVLRLQKKKLMR